MSSVINFFIQVTPTNNDPKVVASFYLNAVKTWGAPQVLRTDCGTENTITSAIQSEIRQSMAAHVYGTSQHNQRIEALWSKLKQSVIQEWASFFLQLTASDIVHEGDVEETAVLRFCFMGLVQQSLDNFMRYWNTHNIVQTSDSPGGVPDILFYAGPSLHLIPSPVSIQQAEEYSEMPTITGSADFDEFLQLIMDQQLLTMPQTKDEAVLLFDKLCPYMKQ